MIQLIQRQIREHSRGKIMIYGNTVLGFTTIGGGIVMRCVPPPREGKGGDFGEIPGRKTTSGGGHQRIGDGD